MKVMLSESERINDTQHTGPSALLTKVLPDEERSHGEAPRVSSSSVSQGDPSKLRNGRGISTLSIPLPLSGKWRRRFAVGVALFATAFALLLAVGTTVNVGWWQLSSGWMFLPLTGSKHDMAPHGHAFETARLEAMGRAPRLLDHALFLRAGSYVYVVAVRFPAASGR